VTGVDDATYAFSTLITTVVVPVANVVVAVVKNC
jgi:hypothetical protein